MGAVLLAVAPWFALLLSTLAPDHGWDALALGVGVEELDVIVGEADAHLHTSSVPTLLPW